MSVRLLATAHDALGAIEVQKREFLKTTSYFATEIFMTEDLFELLSEYCRRTIVSYPTSDGAKKVMDLRIHITKDDGYKFWLGVDKEGKEIKILGE